MLRVRFKGQFHKKQNKTKTLFSLNEKTSESHRLLFYFFLPPTQHTQKRTPGNFTHTRDLTWVELLLSSSCDTVTTITTEFQTESPSTAVRSHFPIIFLFHHMVLRLYKLPSRSGSNVPTGCWDSSWDSTSSAGVTSPAAERH